jgi:hypothetical protein
VIIDPRSTMTPGKRTAEAEPSVHPSAKKDRS